MFGQTDDSAAAPYKLETPTLELEPTEVIESTAVVEQPVKKSRAKKPAAIATTTLEVKAKYKRADLTKMSKKELLDLTSKHKIEVKSRATKEELVKTLAKV